METFLKPIFLLLDKIPWKLFFLRKKTYQLLSIGNLNKRNIAFIVGCQRSGTTLMHQIFDNDFNTKVYGEFSILSSDDIHKRIRLNPLDSVEKVIRKDRATLIVLKPLVETQRLIDLLNFFKGSKAIFMYRNYKDVAFSDLTHFGIKNGINNLRPIVENDPLNWRSEKVSGYVRETILNFFSEDMNPYDAAALFWFARNRLFFDLNLDNNTSVFLCKYEDLVRFPLSTVDFLYSKIGQDFPGIGIVKNVHSASIGRGNNINLDPKVDSLCSRLLDDIDKRYNSRLFSEFKTIPMASRGKDTI